MITLFSEEVEITSTNSDRNTIFVESYEEVFFGVYEFEINGTVVIAEKVGTYQLDPVVSIPVVEADGSKTYVEFVLNRGPFEVQIGGAETVLTESTSVTEAQQAHQFDQENAIKEIKTDIDATLAELRLETNQAVNEVDRLRDEIFIEFTSNSDNYRARESDKLRAFVTEKLADVAADNKVVAEELESKLATTLDSEFKGFVNKVRDAQQELKKRALENRKIVASVNALERGQIELNNELATNKEEILEATETSQRNVNKALSRLGTVKKELTDTKNEFDILKEAWANEVNMEEVKAIRESAEEHVKAYFSNKIEQVKEEEIDKLKKEEIFEALNESKESILEDIKASGMLKREVRKLTKEVAAKVNVDTVTENEVRKIAGEIIALTVHDDKESRITQKDVHAIVNESVKAVVTNQPIVEQTAVLDATTKKQITENLKIELDGRFKNEMSSIKRMIELAGGGGGIGDAPNDGQTYSRENGKWVIASGGGGGAVNKIIAGDNVTVSPVGGTGNVTVNAVNTGSDVSTLSSSWEGTYTTVQANSASWAADGGSDVSTLSANWQNTYTTVDANSANWDTAYTAIAAKEGTWDTAASTVTAKEGTWDGAYTTVQANSANWNEVGSDVSTISGNWEGTYDTVSDLSANWSGAYSTVQSNSASWTGGGGGGVTEIIAGTNITIDQGTGQVTINATADGIGSDVSTISANWQNTWTTVDANSANWETAYTTVNAKEATWDDTTSTVATFSASWADMTNAEIQAAVASSDLDMDGNRVLFSNVYTNLVDLPSATDNHGMFAHVHATGKAYFAHSGSWVELANFSDIGSGGSDVSALTANWESTYNTTKDLSASWSSAYDQVSALSAQWGGGTYDSNLASNIAMTEDVGGLDTGTTVASLTGSTFSQLFDSLLFPTVNPVVGSNNSTGLSDNVTNLQTIGATINITLNTTAGLGTLRLNGITQGDYAGSVTSAAISGPNSTSYNPSVGPGGTDIDNQVVTGHVVSEGTNQWSMVTTFGEGPMPLDSAGNDYPSIRFAAGGTRSASTSFEGVYPIKLGASTGSANFDDRALTSHNSNNIEASQDYTETASLRHRIAIPNDMIDAQTVGFQQWNTVSSSYSDIAASSFTSSSTTFTVEGNTVNYTLYTKTGPPGGGDSSGQPIYRITFS